MHGRMYRSLEIIQHKKIFVRPCSELKYFKADFLLGAFFSVQFFLFFTWQ